MAEAKIRNAFPTPIIEARLSDVDARNAALAAVIRQRRESSPGLQRSNVIGWHSDTEMLQWGGDAAKALAIETLELCGKYTADIGMKENKPRYRMAMEMWANVSPPGSSNQMHSHPGALWSAVYYVDDGGDAEGGALILLDPKFPGNRMYAPDLVFQDDAGKREENQVKISPTPGAVVIFPSWLMHGVKPHAGPRDRISIAMNVMALPAIR
jgi:uncharacterized protein (TIGR02466 family)